MSPVLFKNVPQCKCSETKIGQRFYLSSSTWKMCLRFRNNFLGFTILCGFIFPFMLVLMQIAYPLNKLLSFLSRCQAYYTMYAFGKLTCKALFWYFLVVMEPNFYFHNLWNHNTQLLIFENGKTKIWRTTEPKP